MAKVWLGVTWALAILLLVVVVPWGAGAYQEPTVPALTPTATPEGRPIESNGQRAVVATNSPLPVGATAPIGESAAATPTSPVRPSNGAVAPPVPAAAPPTPTATLAPTASLEPTPTIDPGPITPGATATTDPFATATADPDDERDNDSSVTPLPSDEAVVLNDPALQTRSFDNDNRVYFPLMLR